VLKYPNKKGGETIMAKFSTKAVSALELILKLRSLHEIQAVIAGLEDRKRNEEVKTANIEHVADTILEKMADGFRTGYTAGRLYEQQLTEHLGADELSRALSIAKSVYDSIKAEREVWLLAKRKEHEAGRYPPKWDEAAYREKGPGVVPGRHPI